MESSEITEQERRSKRGKDGEERNVKEYIQWVAGQHITTWTVLSTWHPCLPPFACWNPEPLTHPPYIKTKAKTASHLQDQMPHTNYYQVNYFPRWGAGEEPGKSGDGEGCHSGLEDEYQLQLCREREHSSSFHFDPTTSLAPLSHHHPPSPPTTTSLALFSAIT